MDFVYLENELETFFFDMKTSVDFNTLKRVECLAAKLVKTKKHIVYPLVYKLIKLVLVLPVSTASVERSFSAMKVVKNRLRNKMGDKWMNDCLIAYIEKEVLQGIDNKLIVKRFQKDATRRGQLPKRSQVSIFISTINGHFSGQYFGVLFCIKNYCFKITIIVDILEGFFCIKNYIFRIKIVVQSPPTNYGNMKYMENQ